MGASLPPKALHGLMSNSSSSPSLTAKSISVSAAAAYGQSVNGAAILSRLDARCQPEIGGASEGATRRPARPRAVFPSANCPLPPIYFLRSLRFARPSLLIIRTEPSIPACLPEFGILSETIPPSLSPRWDGPIYGNLVEGVVAAAGPFLEVVVGKQETAIAPPAVE